MQGSEGLTMTRAYPEGSPLGEGKEILLQPYVRYRNFFDERIKQSSGLANGILRTAHVASAIFAYPIFGLLATMNLVKNLYTTPDLEGDILTKPLKKYHSLLEEKVTTPLPEGRGF